MAKLNSTRHFPWLIKTSFHWKDNDSTELTDENLDDGNMWIYIKDRFNISNEAWHELAMKTKQMPNNYKK